MRPSSTALRISINSLMQNCRQIPFEPQKKKESQLCGVRGFSAGGPIFTVRVRDEVRRREFEVGELGRGREGQQRLDQSVRSVPNVSHGCSERSNVSGRLELQSGAEWAVDTWPVQPEEREGRVAEGSRRVGRLEAV